MLCSYYLDISVFVGSGIGDNEWHLPPGNNCVVIITGCGGRRSNHLIFGVRFGASKACFHSSIKENRLRMCLRIALFPGYIEDALLVIIQLYPTENAEVGLRFRRSRGSSSEEQSVPDKYTTHDLHSGTVLGITGYNLCP